MNTIVKSFPEPEYVWLIFDLQNGEWDFVSAHSSKEGAVAEANRISESVIEETLHTEYESEVLVILRQKNWRCSGCLRYQIERKVVRP